MKIALFCLVLLHSSVSFASPHTDSLTRVLNQAIQDAPVYDNRKLKEISTLRALLLEIPKADFSRRYDIHQKLYETYKYYNYDSALNYAKELQQLARYKNDASLIIDSRLKAVFMMLSGGMFKETFDSLNAISVEHTADSVKAEYYSLIGRAYYNLADYNSDNFHTPFYNGKANLYLDSALALYAPGSFEHLYYAALKFLKKGKPDSALSYLNRLVEGKNLSYHQTALATSTIGGIYLSEGNEGRAKPYLIEASIADLKSSTKETLALLQLAGIVYKEGNIEAAVGYIEKANADATFYNARLRKVQVGAILPLIEGGMIQTIKTQKAELEIFLILLSVLVLLLAGFAIIIRNQLKKLKVIRASLSEANLKQQQINRELSESNNLKERYNAQLQETNSRLSEANSLKEKYNEQLEEINRQLLEVNKIKDEYIGYYFRMDTEFLTRIEKLINSITKKLADRKWDEIKFVLQTVDPKKEKDELLKNFDKVFLKLFPSFIFQFNSLFKEEDKIVLKEDQLLNTELRIFALIRLGITENEKIAEILGYSINTIYAKKTKVRSKTLVPKDNFEKKITEITTLSF